MTRVSPRGRTATASGTQRDLGPLVTATVGLALFALAFNGGAYGSAARSAAAIACWWALAIAVGLRLFPVRSFGRAAWAIAGLLGALAALGLVSATWSDSAERAFAEFNRGTLFLGIFTLAVLVGPSAAPGRWLDGVAAATVGTAALALVSRVLPSLAPTDPLEQYLPGIRLSYPLNYWNALSIFVALGVPPLLHAAVAARRRLVRSMAVALFPLVAATMYLTASRGGVLTAAVGGFVFVALSRRGWAAVGVLATALPAVVAAVVLLESERDLVVLVPGRVHEDEWGTALGMVAICVGTGLLHGVAAHLLRGVRVPRRATVAAIVGTIAVALVGSAFAKPVERFEAFKRPPVALGQQKTVARHLLDTGGTGRWQVWAAAADAFRDSPLVGQGAGTFETWWSQHGTVALPNKDAHSLYLETLAELGIVGLIPLAGLVLLALAGAARRLRGAVRSDRPATAALAAVVVAYLVAAGLDWMWEFPAVTAILLIALGVLAARAHGDAGAPLARRSSALATVAAVIAALAVVAAHGVSLLTEEVLTDSREAVVRGDLAEAVERARAARSLQPWAATPRLQLALVLEESGELGAAERAITEAIERDRLDWHLWLVAARIQAATGAEGDARSSLRESIRLNPRSPLLRRLRLGLNDRR